MVSAWRLAERVTAAQGACALLQAPISRVAAAPVRRRGSIPPPPDSGFPSVNKYIQGIHVVVILPMLSYDALR